MLAVRMRCSLTLDPSVNAVDDVHMGSGVPAVMLSPNATNFVALSLGNPATVTLKLHDEVCCFASRAVHVTFVDPTLNRLPLAGVHVVETGCAPPEVAGAG